MKPTSTYEAPRILLIMLTPTDLLTASQEDEGEWDIPSKQ